MSTTVCFPVFLKFRSSDSIVIFIIVIFGEVCVLCICLECSETVWIANCTKLSIEHVGMLNQNENGVIFAPSCNSMPQTVFFIYDIHCLLICIAQIGLFRLNMALFLPARFYAVNACCQLSFSFKTIVYLILFAKITFYCSKQRHKF